MPSPSKRFTLHEGGKSQDFLIDSGGSDGNNTGMEARIAKLEAHAEHVDTTLSDIKLDIRELRQETSTLNDSLNSKFFWMLGIFGVGFITILGVMAKGFKWF